MLNTTFRLNPRTSKRRLHRHLALLRPCGTMTGLKQSFTASHHVVESKNALSYPRCVSMVLCGNPNHRPPTIRQWWPSPISPSR